MFRFAEVSTRATRQHFAPVENPGRTVCGRSTRPAVFGSNPGPVFAEAPDHDPGGVFCRSCVRIMASRPLDTADEPGGMFGPLSPAPVDPIDDSAPAPLTMNPADPMRAAPLVGAVLFVFVVFVASMLG